MKVKFIKKGELNQLPKSPGVYFLKSDKEILYIGKATNIRERVKNHFQQPGYRDNIFINQVSKVGFIKTNSEIEALILEANLIKKYQPKYNVVWRDDKNYFYVAKTIEDFPRIFWTHQTKISKVQSLKSKVQYIGPFVDGKALKETLKVLRKVFPYRTCKNLPNRPCLWYHLERCPAPCLIKTKLEEKILSKRIKKECQNNAKNLMKVLQGKKVQVLKNLKREMQELSKNQDFERAAKIRDQIESLEKIMENAKIFEPEIGVKLKPWQEFNAKWKKTEKELKKLLKIKGRVSRIEAYDVSNIQGKAATGSMVTFINGLPDKNFYRRFKIKIAKGPNDIAMIKEVLLRRLKHKEWPYPDLILIDGGKAQLNAAIKCKRQDAKCEMIKIVALAKEENKLFIAGQRKPILLKNLPREIFNLILQLRDEAHRFAKKYHLKLREVDLGFK